MVYRALDIDGQQVVEERADDGGTRHRAAYRISRIRSVSSTPAVPVSRVLLLAWFAFTVATIILWIALLIPGHAGLSDLLGALNGLLRSAALGSTT